MNARKWVELFQDRGVDIRVDSKNSWLPQNDGAYIHATDKIVLTQRLNKETLFHEIAHWTADRLDRDMGYLVDENYDPAKNDLEESIAWECTRLMVERFGGGNRYYYEYAPLHMTKDSPETKFFGRQAYEFICNEFGL